MKQKITGNSHIITTNQSGVHEDLKAILSRYSLTNYKRPLADFSILLWKEIMQWVQGSEVVFDLGCGVGASSIYLSSQHPEAKIVAIDKSISRLERKNKFKENLPENIRYFRGELLDIIPLIYKASIEKTLDIKSIYILYPNPYPKNIHIKKRFHGNPVSIFLFNTKVPIILRSNWKLYLEEFSYVGQLFGRESEIKLIENPEMITPFERKYHNSSQKLYELKLN